MAKGKHAAALFEVIHSGRFPNKPEMQTPKWWFKRKGNAAPADGSATEAPAASETTATAENAADDPTVGATARSMLGAPATTATTTTREQSQSSRNGNHELADGNGDDSAPSVDVSLDPRHHRITFRVTYSSAIITAFAILVAVGVAYLVGRKMSRGPAMAVASETSEQLRARPARPDVLNVPPANNLVNPPHSSTSGTNPAPPREPDGGVTSRPPAETHDNPGTQPPTPATGAQGRVIGQNYLVIQSYPDEKSALDARDALLKAGIGCTVEHQKFRGLNPDWYTVVGTQGFARASGGEYEAYKKRLADLSQEFAQTKRSFKAFALLPYKWDKSGS